MRWRRRAAGALALAALIPGVGSAAPPASVQVEVEFLLAGIRSSGCRFLRNGTWHEGEPAAAHLRDKFDYLVLRGRITSTEDFIAGAASHSSLSGSPYAVKCAGSEQVSSDQWLRDRLARYRASGG